METDINYLLHRQQMALIQAQGTPSAKGKAAYEGLARGYTGRIDAYRQANQRLILSAH